MAKGDRASAPELLGLASLTAAALAAAVWWTATAGAQQSVLDRASLYPEAAQFVGTALYVPELGGDRVSVFEGGRKRTFFHEAGCGPASVRPYRDGLAIFCHLAGEIVVIDKAGVVAARLGKGLLRDPNDGCSDGKGGLYLTDPGLFSKETRATGLVYHLTAAGAFEPVARDLWYPNGVYVEKGRLFLSETFRRKVWRYTIAPSGALVAKTLFLDVDKAAPKPRRFYREAGPDGLARAPSGEMVIAMYGEGRLLRISRAGRFVGQIDVPFDYVDNVAFGAAGGVIVGAYNNLDPPYDGEVRWWSP
jgi:sugar lactone lactonase YvrE